jgi:hypothetical protein
MKQAKNPKQKGMEFCVCTGCVCDVCTGVCVVNVRVSWRPRGAVMLTHTLDNTCPAGNAPELRESDSSSLPEWPCACISAPLRPCSLCRGGMEVVPSPLQLPDGFSWCP